MRGNWIEMSATQAAANANPVALSAVANLPTFADVFGAAGTRRIEYEIDDGAGHYEAGEGTINLATLTLTRTQIFQTYDSGATPKGVNGGTAFLTTFSGPVTVRCAPLATSVPGGELLYITSAGQLTGGMVGNGYGMNRADIVETTTLQGWRNFIPFLWTGARPITSVGINVTTAGTAGTLRVGIMEIKDVNTLSLIQEFTATTPFDLTVSGIQTRNNFAPLALPPGSYVLQFLPIGQAGAPKLSSAGAFLNARSAVFPRRPDGKPTNCLLDTSGATNLAASLSTASQLGNGGSTPITLPDIFFGMN